MSLSDPIKAALITGVATVTAAVVTLVGAIARDGVEHSPTAGPTQITSGALSTAAPTPAVITLDYPQEGQPVPCQVDARGSSSADLSERLWPIVQVVGRYYPQGEAAIANGAWSATVGFGDCDRPDSDRGRPFGLAIVTATDRGDRALEDYLEGCGTSGQCGGMVALPEGTTERVRVAVIRE